MRSTGSNMWRWRLVRRCLRLACRKSRERATVQQQKIVRFHQDEQGDWIADLECGHSQHVRHNPSWMIRLWVTSDEGRESRVGSMLGCKMCEGESRGCE